MQGIRKILKQVQGDCNASGAEHSVRGLLRESKPFCHQISLWNNFLVEVLISRK